MAKYRMLSIQDRMRLQTQAEDEWEKKLIGSIAKGGKTLDGLVKYTPDGHYTYGKCEEVQIQLEAGVKDD